MRIEKNNNILGENQNAFDTNCVPVDSLNFNAIFAHHLNKKIDAKYGDRLDRNRFAAQRIKELNLTNILNIGGGGRRHLAHSLGKGFKVFEIDIVGDCDLKLNLDQVDRLPFSDNSFDLCCAFDVLEHLENFHLINSELLRVSKSAVLISLPNSASEIYTNVLRNRVQKDPAGDRGVFSKFYGLPLRSPADRHRWWLYFYDIVRFYYLFATMNNCHLEFWKRQEGIAQKIRAQILGSHLTNTFFTRQVWIKLTKSPKSII